MTTGYIETTVLTNALLKPTWTTTAADLKKYTATELPVYAIKEFKAGPLRYARWLHNTLATTQSFSATLNAVHALMRTPQRYLPSTAMELLANTSATLLRRLTGDAATTYGSAPEQTQDAHFAKEMELEVKSLVFRAWQRRRRLASRVVQSLSCYQEVAPVEVRGLLHIKPKDCNPQPECCLAPLLRANEADLRKLREVCKTATSKEMQSRSAILKKLLKGNVELSNDECRRLGDVMFAFFAPQDMPILTTNLKDLKPLAEALGKTAKIP